MNTYPTDIVAQPGDPFIEVLRDFDATPAQLFRAWTRPELVVQWLGPRGKTMELLEFDVRSGGSYRYVHRDAEGREFRFRGVFHTVADDERIIQTFEWEGAPGEVNLESLTFESLGDRTRVHSHAIFPSVEARDAAIANGMDRGISESLNRLEELLASQQQED
jgi:uncharacterized protein YndB with AHSA1/START domain